MKKGVPYSDPPPHGTHARYVSKWYKCHGEDCDGACARANAEYMADYRARRKNNAGRPLESPGLKRSPSGKIFKNQT